AWTIALRSRKNHNISFRYTAFLANRDLPRAREGCRSAAETFPLSPFCAPHTLNHTALAVVTPATLQQAANPDINENIPSGFAPRNNPNQGHGRNVKNPPILPSRPLIVPNFCTKNSPNKNIIIVA